MTKKKAVTKKKLDPFIVLNDALELVFDGLAIAGKAQLKNPTKEEQRLLSRVEARLELERADIVAAMDVILDEDDEYPPPTSTQVAQIAWLSKQVEGLTRDALTASAGLALAGSILEKIPALSPITVGEFLGVPALHPRRMSFVVVAARYEVAAALGIPEGLSRMAARQDRTTILDRDAEDA